MSARSVIAPPRLIARIILLAILLAATIVAMSAVGGAVASSAFALPCLGDPPPPPPEQCGGQPCPTLPNTGGGGGPCEDDPADPACQGGSIAPRTLFGGLRLGELRLSAPHMVSTNDSGDRRSPVVVAHPCPGDPPSSGNEPAPVPPPPPPIPVCAACEAPGVAASVELPAVRVRMNPDTGLVNLPTWFWAEGYLE